MNSRKRETATLFLVCTILLCVLFPFVFARQPRDVINYERTLADIEEWRIVLTISLTTKCNLSTNALVCYPASYLREQLCQINSINRGLSTNDPWNTPYIININTGHQCKSKHSDRCRERYAIWSCGRNRSNEFGYGDDINSWETESQNDLRVSKHLSLWDKIVSCLW